MHVGQNPDYGFSSVGSGSTSYGSNLGMGIDGSYNVVLGVSGESFLVKNGGGTLLFGANPSGVVTYTGANTATSGAAVLTPTFASGTAAQLTDTTKDYVIYLACTTSGTGFTLF